MSPASAFAQFGTGFNSTLNPVGTNNREIFMTIKTGILAASALLFAATSASAAVQTVSRHGSIFFQFAPDFAYNPDHLTSLLDFQIGDAIDLTITYDDAEIGPLVRGINASPNPLLTNPNITGVALGNGNPANSVTFTVGSHTVGLSDFACAPDPDACEAATGFDFHFGPTAIFYRGRFLGIDSLFGIGGSPFTNPGIGQFVKYVLVDGDPTFPAAVGAPNRTDYVFLSSAGQGNFVFLGKFDGPGVTSVPEPASWAMLIAGFGLTGAAMRRRQQVSLLADGWIGRA